MDEKLNADYYLLYGPESLSPKPPEISEAERLLNAFEAHESDEARFVQRYKEIAEKTRNPLTRFLLRMIISDEETHRTLTHGMVSTLRGDITWTKRDDAFTGLYDVGKDRDELLELTEEFIRVEKQGIKAYKDLAKVSKGYYRGLFVLLFQSMIYDSEKHVEILEFLRQKLKGA